MQLNRYNAHWRDSARKPRFFIVDARLSLLLLVFLIHIRLWTFFVLMTATIFLSVLEYYGMSVEVFMRWMRSQLAGSRKCAIPWWLQS